MPYAIRRYRDSDAERLADIVDAAIRRIGPHCYTPEQVSAWAARHPGAQRLRQRVVAGAEILIAVDRDDMPAAYALIEPDGHLDHLYCHPEHTRQRLADRVLGAVADYARRQGMVRLYTEASELARPAFLRAGYRLCHRRDFALEHNGETVPIHNYAMEKALI